jgi:hypothetical protein
MKKTINVKYDMDLKGVVLDTKLRYNSTRELYAFENDYFKVFVNNYGIVSTEGFELDFNAFDDFKLFNSGNEVLAVAVSNKIHFYKTSSSSKVVRHGFNLDLITDIKLTEIIVWIVYDSKLYKFDGGDTENLLPEKDGWKLIDHNVKKIICEDQVDGILIIKNDGKVYKLKENTANKSVDKIDDMVVFGKHLFALIEGKLVSMGNKTTIKTGNFKVKSIQANPYLLYVEFVNPSRPLLIKQIKGDSFEQYQLRFKAPDDNSIPYASRTLLTEKGLISQVNRGSRKGMGEYFNFKNEGFERAHFFHNCRFHDEEDA